MMLVGSGKDTNKHHFICGQNMWLLKLCPLALGNVGTLQINNACL
jgi:hypothetical protein